MQISYKYIIFDTFKKCVFVIFELFARSTDYRHIAFGGGGVALAQQKFYLYLHIKQSELSWSTPPPPLLKRFYRFNFFVTQQRTSIL